MYYTQKIRKGGDVLETIKKHDNRRRYEIQQAKEVAKRSGIQCPGCGKEMCNTGNMKMSCPPQKEIYCMSCGQREMVLA